MQRSSPSIGAIAAALAKAQAELVNPEKSLVAVLRVPNEPERTFRYAPLASGLDIVRKSLGRHEIATVQTTSIDGEAGLIQLTTVLAHSSGEWVSSDWPVCPVGEIATPQRLGAALTYARRYALFTLVGIAGEDDLDAPDLAKQARDPMAPRVPEAGPSSRDGVASPGVASVASTTTQRAARIRPFTPVLSVEESAGLRDELLAACERIGSTEELTRWAQQVLPAKNRLQREDARAVENAFGTRKAALDADPDGVTAREPSVPAPPEQDRPEQEIAGSEMPEPLVPEPSPRLALPKTKRKRDKEHLAFVAAQPCLVCGRSPSDPHHLRFAEPRALGRKVSDEFTVPLCRAHHRELHGRGDERAWWNSLNIDPAQAAERLWGQSHA
jgi:hypothetical protein